MDVSRKKGNQNFIWIIIQWPSLPPSKKRKTVPGGKALVSASYFKLTAAANKRLCLLSRNGGRRNVGCVPASPACLLSSEHMWVVSQSMAMESGEGKNPGYTREILIARLTLNWLLSHDRFKQGNLEIRFNPMLVSPRFEVYGHRFGDLTPQASSDQEPKQGNSASGKIRVPWK